MGFGAQGGSAKAFVWNNECVWWKHGLCDTCLVQGCIFKVRNAVKYRVEAISEALCARNAPGRSAMRPPKHCYPEIPLGRHPTSRASQS